MSFNDIQNRFTINAGIAGNSFETKVIAIMRLLVDTPGGASDAIFGWLSQNLNSNITVNFSPGNANAGTTADLGRGIVNIDPSFFNNDYYINSVGKTVQFNFKAGLTHELGHALVGTTDALSISNFSGSNDDLVNLWYQSLGIQSRVSYIAADMGPSILTVGKSYTQGKSIKNAIIDIGSQDFEKIGGGFFRLDTGNIDLTVNGVVGSALIIGSGENNNYTGSTSDDWIYGNGGIDLINGGDGNDALYGGEGTDLFFARLRTH